MGYIVMRIETATTCIRTERTTCLEGSVLLLCPLTKEWETYCYFPIVGSVGFDVGLGTFLFPLSRTLQGILI